MLGLILAMGLQEKPPQKQPFIVFAHVYGLARQFADLGYAWLILAGFTHVILVC